MSTIDNNPVYYIEEDHRKSSKVYYKSSNEALIRKASQRPRHFNKTIRTIVVLLLFVIAVSCVALIRAFASTHEQPVQPVTSIHSDSTVINAVSLKVHTVYIEKGDTLWAIANKYAPQKVSIQSYINKLMKVNGLTQPILQIGQALILP
jgi:LysM repeat protein